MFAKLLSAVVITTVLFSCGSNDTKTTTPAATETVSPPHTDNSAAKKTDFSNVKFDVQKDLACGMSLKSGIEDTAQYKGKIYGFCSKECKDDFVKNPESFLAKK